MSRKWGKLTEGTPGELEEWKNSHLNELVKRAGGNVELTKALQAISPQTKAVPEMLFDQLAKIFKFTQVELTVGFAAFWNTHGAPAVELETDLLGGIFDLHGTHMRSWLWWHILLQHPQLACHVGAHGSSTAVTKAICNVAMLTCGPTVWPRICRQARKMLWSTGMVGLLEALWGCDAVPVLCRTGHGGDTTNHLLVALGKNEPPPGWAVEYDHEHTKTEGVYKRGRKILICTKPGEPQCGSKEAWQRHLGLHKPGTAASARASRYMSRYAPKGDISRLKYAVIKHSLSAKKKSTKTVVPLTTFEHARNAMIDLELPRRVAYYDRVKLWSSINKVIGQG